MAPLLRDDGVDDARTDDRCGVCDLFVCNAVASAVRNATPGARVRGIV